MGEKEQVSFTANPQDKKGATKIANQLGISLSAALNMCLKQMIYQHGLPFSTRVPIDLPKSAFVPDNNSDIKRRLEKIDHGYLGIRHHLIEK